MENETHKGTELNNVKETWDQNERNLQNENSADPGATADATTPKTDLDRLVQQEAREYDNANKEERLLDGDRATVNDDSTDVGSVE